LGKISELDEDGNIFRQISFTIGIQGSQNRTAFRFIPVPKEFASDYGKAGNLLHCAFFESNEDWYTKKRLKDKYGSMSLFDYRDVLGDIAKRLEEASSSELIIPPSFLKFFDELNRNVEE
jgi:hypothetical protein